MQIAQLIKKRKKNTIQMSDLLKEKRKKLLADW